MGAVVLHVSMSIDGFIAGPRPSVAHAMGEGGERLHDWIFGRATGGVVDPRDAEIATAMLRDAGAVVMGRRTFEVGIGHWGEDGAFRMPCFVATHTPADPLIRGATSFTFVTEGLERTLEKARAAAAGKNINVMGADVAQQLLRAGEIDELEINLVPVLLGEGVRLFGRSSAERSELELLRVIESSAVTHRRYRRVTVSSPGG